MEDNVAINIKMETLFRRANLFREGRGRKIARVGGNISSWGEEIFPPPSDFVMGETLFSDTGSVQHLITGRPVGMFVYTQHTLSLYTLSSDPRQ